MEKYTENWCYFSLSNKQLDQPKGFRTGQASEIGCFDLFGAHFGCWRTWISLFLLCLYIGQWFSMVDLVSGKSLGNQQNYSPQPICGIIDLVTSIKPIFDEIWKIQGTWIDAFTMDEAINEWINNMFELLKKSNENKIEFDK